MSGTIYIAASLIVPLIIAIVFHEVSHGWVANLLGDHTAKRRGRLSLNPLRHVDPIGTLVVPGFLALVKAPVLGWAKPVPVVKERLRNPRSGMMAVAAAGPASNLVLAAIGAIVLGLVAGADPTMPAIMTPRHFVLLNLSNFITINIFLALFNLLPIPPFDGSHIVEGLLPRWAAAAYDRLRPLGMGLVLLLIVALPMLFPQASIIERIVLPPVEWALDRYLALAEAVARF